MTDTRCKSESRDDIRVKVLSLKVIVENYSLIVNMDLCSIGLLIPKCFHLFSIQTGRANIKTTASLLYKNYNAVRLE